MSQNPTPLDYADASAFKGKKQATPAEQRRDMWIAVALSVAAISIYWVGLYLTCSPAWRALGCLDPMAFLLIVVLWVAVTTKCVKFAWSEAAGHQAWRFRLTAVVLLVLLPYVALRGSNDVFALAVRREIAAAGGAAQLRAKWAAWYPALAAESAARAAA